MNSLLRIVLIHPPKGNSEGEKDTSKHCFFYNDKWKKVKPENNSAAAEKSGSSIALVPQDAVT